MSSDDFPQLRLYNTLTREKQHFEPIDRRNVRMYVCGPTVYDFAHIGNARPVIVFDLLFRLLRQIYGAGNVTYVRNITDVDDKINARAARDFPDMALNAAIRQVTEATNRQYQQDVKSLGCLEPSVQPRATEHIPEMIAIAETLIAGGHAYVAEGHVLFAPSTMPDYGRLANRSTDDMLAGARVDVAPYKRDPMDFVLWKPSSPEEPGWDSPWGRGRPGWHIECSAMSEKHLGPVFDIHGGGIDLVFPHHENELAQSRCAHGTPIMAQVWMHNGFLQLEGRKMSKSEGNFVTINELLTSDAFGGRAWSGEVLRLAMLMTHYREPIDFSAARLAEAEQKLRDWQRAAGQAGNADMSDPDDSVTGELMDDLNFHRASVAMDVMARKANRGTQSAAACLGATLQFLGFGRDTLLAAAPDDRWLDARITAAIGERLAALASGNFAEADTIRAGLLAEGVHLMDYKDKDTGERRTRWELTRQAGA